MSAPSLYLYIFSGPHMGAQIALGLGKHLIGSDESADILLYAQSSNQDFAIAPRHAQLEISQEGLDNAFITISAVDGNIYKDFTTGTEEVMTVQSGQIFYIASTCMVWNYPSVNQERIFPDLIQQASLAANSQEAQLEPDNNVDKPLEEPLSNEADNLSTDNNILENHEQAALDSAEKEKKKRKKHIYKIAMPLIAALLLLGLSVSFTPQKDNIGLEANYLVTKLAEHQIDNVEVFQQTINNQNSILIEGHVKSEAERKTIQDLARSLHHPVYLSLNVQEDTIKAAQNSFMLMGVYPFLELKDSVLHVSAYIKDYLIEEAAFADVKHEVTNIPPMERNVIHQEDLSLRMDAKFAEHGIKNARAIYGNGSLTVAGNFNKESIQGIHQSMNEIMDDIQIPLSYTVVLTGEIKNTVAQTPVQETVKPTENLIQHVEEAKPNPTVQVQVAEAVKEENQGEAITLGGLNITSVNTGAIPFITTQDGQRLFAGALLPNGYTVQAIKSDSVTLTKGTQTITIAIQQ